MPTLETRDGTRLHYTEAGEGPPVLLMHGWPLDGEMWSEHAAALARRGFRVVRYDRRGFGRSDQPWHGYDYDSFADDLRDVLAGLDLTGVTLVGYSTASGEAVRYVARHGSSRVSRIALVACDTPFLIRAADNPDGLDPAMVDAVAAQLVDDRPTFLRAFHEECYGGWASADLMDRTLRTSMLASMRATVESVRAVLTTDFRPDLAVVDVPTLVVHGTADRTSPIELSGRPTAAAVPSARLLEYEGHPHALPATAGDRLTADLLAFMSAA